MKVIELINKIEKKYPLDSAYEFDNTGANIVDNNVEISGILVCLDVTLDAIELAHKNNINMIISHHPMVFNSYKNINEDIISKRIKKLIRYNINAYSIHTNFDVNLKFGMGQLVVDKIFKKSEIKKQDLIEEFYVNKIKYGLGNVIILNKSMDFATLSERVLSKLNVSIDKTSLYSINNQKIKKIVILPGSGSGDIDKVILSKCDCFVTSDLKHNQILDLLENKISYLNATHYGLEKIFIEYISDYLKKIVKTKILIYDNTNI